jgi:hypothetical protein
VKSKPFSQNKKITFAYFSSVLITLGYVASGFLTALQPSFGLFVGGVAGLAGLIFGANVVQKATTKEVYLKELQMKNGDPKPEDNDLGGVH